MKIEIDPQRSATMRAVKSRDTKPEVHIRSILHRSGYRFRLHRKDLPGTPDIVFAKRRKVVLVHGCFWHGHTCRRGDRVPKNNRGYWVGKVRRNRERDSVNSKKLADRGWKIFVVWECQIHSPNLLNRLTTFLDSPAGPDNRVNSTNCHRGRFKPDVPGTLAAGWDEACT